MDPVTAAILLGTITSMAGMRQSQQQAKAARRAAFNQKKAGIENQNRIVEEGFQKRQQAIGLGGKNRRVLGDLASQSGAALTSVTGESNSILG